MPPQDHNPAQDSQTPVFLTPATPTGSTATRRPLGNPARKGVQPLKMKSFKVGAVAVLQLEPEKWRLRYSGPDGRDIRQRVSGVNEKDIRVTASSINHTLLTGKGFLPGRTKASDVPELEDGIVRSISLRNSADITNADRLQRGYKFLNWMAKHHPTVSRWDQMRPEMLQEYILEAERRGLSPYTIRLDVAPIRLAWLHMSQNYPEVRPLPKLRLKPAPKTDVQCLDRTEVIRLLGWLRENAPTLWPMAVIQATMGLRVLEVAALRAQDVDLTAGTITITKTPLHSPKNTNSHRTLPLTLDAAEALRFAMGNQKLVPTGGEIFVNSDGGHWRLRSLSHRWQHTLIAAAKSLEEPRFRTPIRKLRASFATMAVRMGAHDRLLKAFLGHGQGDILGGHYLKIKVAELRTVSSLFDQWKEESGKNLAQDAR